MKKLAYLSAVFLILVLPEFINAAPPPPPGGAPCWPPPCVPVDGGIVALMAAGAIYASKKIYDRKKQKSLH